MKNIPALGIGILSLGCPRNLVDSESIIGRLVNKGYRVVDIAKADTAIVNTCAFIKDAKLESIDAILDLIELKKQGKVKKIVVYGCLSQRYKKELKRQLPQVDAFVGRVSLGHGLNNFSLTAGHYGYLKICEGCINNCSYCIIPRIKGKFSSLDTGSLLRQVERFDRQNFKELNIIGQDISAYGMDLYGEPRLSGLLKKIVKKTKNIGWIRLLYLYPDRIDDELLKLVAGEPKICKYIDLPLQHINDRILKLMRRHTTKSGILRLIERIRKIIPDVAIRTSVIVGFPSERDEEFKELLRFIEDVKFERLGAFIYSREEGTPAYNFKKQLHYKTKLSRFNAVMSRQQEIAAEINKRLLGKTVTVIVDNRQANTYLGRTQYDAPEVDGAVYINSEDKLNAGDFLKVKITDTMEYDLVGERV